MLLTRFKRIANFREQVACTIRELISGGLSDVGNAAAFSKRLALARNSLQKLKECADATDGVFVALCDAVDARGRSLVDWLVGTKFVGEFARFSRCTLTVTKSKSSLAVAVSDCVNVLDPIEVDMVTPAGVYRLPVVAETFDRYHDASPSMFGMSLLSPF